MSWLFGPSNSAQAASLYDRQHQLVVSCARRKVRTYWFPGVTLRFSDVIASAEFLSPRVSDQTDW